MLVNAVRLNDHVIHIDLDILAYLMFEDLIHEPLVCSSRIFESKRHEPVTKVGVCNDEGGVVLIWGVHPI